MALLLNTYSHILDTQCVPVVQKNYTTNQKLRKEPIWGRLGTRQTETLDR